MTSICVNAMNACICVTRAAIITPNAVSVKESSNNSPIMVSKQNGTVRYAREPGQGQNDDSLERRNRRTAEAFPDNDR